MKETLKTNIFKLLLIFLVILLDQISKLFLYGQEFSFLPGLIGVRKTSLNTGGAWSMLSDKIWLLIFLSIFFIVVATIFDVFFKSKSKLYSVAFSFVLGGTIGNLIDRLFLGGVRDFIFFEFYPTFPTFNIADSFLCIGMILLFVFVLFFYMGKEEEISKNGK